MCDAKFVTCVIGIVKCVLRLVTYVVRLGIIAHVNELITHTYVDRTYGVIRLVMCVVRLGTD